MTAKQPSYEKKVLRAATLPDNDFMTANDLATVQRPPYRGRFAPSPTGPLHAGSLVAALASWLDARAHDGKWLIRLEDIDRARERPGAAAAQLASLAALGMESDEPVMVQSERKAAYAAAMQQLQFAGRIYICHCTRSQRASAAESAAYPGTCRDRRLDPPGASRFRVEPGVTAFVDRAFGPVAQDVEQAVGDVVVHRADGYWAYQLAVVVDDAAQGITDVVRGADLLDNTSRQIALQRALGVGTPRYLHLPLVLGPDGRKLSKSAGDAPLPRNRDGALRALEAAWAHLGFAPLGAGSVTHFQRRAIPAWRARWAMAAAAGATHAGARQPMSPA